MTKDDQSGRLIQRVGHAIRQIESSARVYLFGSRARGDHGPESDWDFLVVVSGSVDVRRKRAIWDCLYEIELEIGEVLSARVVSDAEWDSEDCRSIPLLATVRKEGVLL